MLAREDLSGSPAPCKSYAKQHTSAATEMETGIFLARLLFTGQLARSNCCAPGIVRELVSKNTRTRVIEEDTQHQILVFPIPTYRGT